MEITRTLHANQTLTLLFQQDEHTHPDAGPLLFCEVEPIGVCPTLRISWDHLAGKWQIDQIIICSPKPLPSS